jgi:hypothetical protein
MEDPIINFDEFDLPFSSESTEVKDNEETSESESDAELEDDEELDASEVKENMESSIPKEAIFIGGIDTEIDNWSTWSIKDEYYIIPLKEDIYDWALFRISWDDNWATWNWSFDARLKGFKSKYKDATKYMLVRLWERWHIDINDKENKLYLTLLNDV